jgi:hypothetical protein
MQLGCGDWGGQEKSTWNTKSSGAGEPRRRGWEWPHCTPSGHLNRSSFFFCRLRERSGVQQETEACFKARVCMVCVHGPGVCVHMH